MKKILGLDLGTNSIGWALIDVEKHNFEKTIFPKGEILGLGSRIIPMQQNEIDDFGKGVTKSATADRTEKRGVRRLYQRDNLRRERLHRVLNILGFLPEHYKNSIIWGQEEGVVEKDWKKRGQFKKDTEIKLPYKAVSEKNEGNKQKYEFIFKEAFEEMLADFKEKQPELFYKKENGEEIKIPYDWTIYYLRKKALEKQISDNELAWIILHFNTKRGYYQQRDDDEYEKQGEKKEFYQLKVVEVKQRDENIKGDGYWYDVILENGFVYRRDSKESLHNWQNTVKEFIVTTKLNPDNTEKTNKDGKIERSFKAVDSEKDWPAIKAYTEQEIDSSDKTVGAYIYDTLLKKPDQKIRGKLVRTIERKYYRKELEQMLDKQVELNPKFKDFDLYKKCITELYPLNDTRRDVLNSVKDENKFKFLFVNDIIFYHRPLKTKKSLIANCKFETRTFINKDGEKEIQAIKAIAKSNPYYQEFRIWQFIDNLKIKEREKEVDGKLKSDFDVTHLFIKTDDDKIKLFEEFNKREKIKQSQFLGLFKNTYGKRLTEKTHKWNYVEKNEYPLNETKHILTAKFKKDRDYLKFYDDNEHTLWHLFYSISGKDELKKALEKLYEKNKDTCNLPDDFVDKAIKIKSFKKDYGTLSEKAIKKILPLLRIGKYADINKFDKIELDELYKNLNSISFDRKKINEITKDESDIAKYKFLIDYEEYKGQIDRIHKRIKEIPIKEGSIDNEKIGEFADDEIIKGMLSSFVDYPENKYTGLKLHQASYAVYGKHSEAKDTEKWVKPEDIEKFLTEEFKQHSLRNPIVEKVVTETLRVVKDIWEQFGNGEEKYFSEIHVELGRDLKNTKAEKERLTDIVTGNKKTNQRIITLLRELKKANIENVRPESPHQRDKLKIFEHDILSPYTEKELKKQEVKGHGIVDIHKITNSNEPSLKEIEKYRLWLDQKYRSPFTNKTIPLSDLFTSKYEIEHVLPQARYLDNSYSNKVICETAVNKAKGKFTGYEFVIKNEGKEIELENGDKRKIVSQLEYEEFVSKNFTKGTKKHKILLSEDIPAEFTDQQKVNMQYISSEMGKLLSRIVKEQGENEVFSKNLLPVPGKATNMLKHDWGLNQVWHELIMPRFERLNTLTETKDFTYYSKKLQKELPSVPAVLKQNFDAKRIDHRHHALDALIIACTTRHHINYINNKHAKSENSRFDLKKKIAEKQYNKESSSDYKWIYKKPWDSFVVETRNSLETIIVSFKQNMRILTKATNKYISYKDENRNIRLDNNGKPKKAYTKQTKGDMRTIRQQLHEETVQGKRNIRFEKNIRLSDAVEGLISGSYFIKDKRLGKYLKNQIKNEKSKKEILAYLKKQKYKFNENDISKVDVYYFSNADNIPETEHKVAVRKELSPALFSSTEKKKASEKIKESISNTVIQQILLKHLNNYNTVNVSIFVVLDKPEILKDEKIKKDIKKLKSENKNLIEYFQKEKINKKNEVEIFISKAKMVFSEDNIIENPDLAFSPEGIEEMNNNIIELNSNKRHKPIYKVRIYTKLGNKFNVGETGNKDKKYVVTGLNPYFAIYCRTDDEKNQIRKYQTISLTTTIDRLKYKLPPVPEKLFDKKENQEYEILFYLQPNDLVYIPTVEETENPNLINFNKLADSQIKRIYKFTDGSGTTGNFVPYYVATTIFNMNKKKQQQNDIAYNIQNEFGIGSPQSKNQNTIDGEIQIKKVCLKLKVNRLGEIVGH